MEALKFKNPTFKPGLNLTVRLGRKWYDALRKAEAKDWIVKTLQTLSSNEPLPDYPPEFDKVRIDLADENDNAVGTGQVELIRGTYFDSIPVHLLEFFHTGEYLSFDELYNMMKEWYGDEFEFGSEVTLIFFTVDQPA